MKTKTVYVSFDDHEFDSAEACGAYEAAHVETRLVGLTAERIRAAVTRDDTDLADAIEEIGKRITKTRIAAGELRRSRPVSDTEPEQVDVVAPAAAKGAGKLDHVIQRARAAGMKAEKDDEVPDLFAGAPELRDAWLAGRDEAATAKAA